jgi:hypothetical protein
VTVLEQLDDRQPLPLSVPAQRAATMARGRQIRRTRRALVASAAVAAGVLVAGVVLGVPTRIAAPPVGPQPSPTSTTPVPRPAGPATLLYPLCAQPQQPPGQPSSNVGDGLPTCTSSERAGLYASALRYPEPALRFTLALPASWTAVGGWPAYPTGFGYFPKGSTSFAAAGDVGTVEGLSLINRDGTAGIRLEAEPSVVSCAAGGAPCTYVKPPGDLVSYLRERSGTGTVRESDVGGLPASIVELAPGAGGGGAPLGCSVPYPCSALVAYNIPPNAGGGSGPPTMGRLGEWPTRVIVVPVPRSGGTKRVVIWLWSVVDRPTNADQRDLDGLEEIARSIRFDVSP